MGFQLDTDSLSTIISSLGNLSSNMSSLSSTVSGYDTSNEDGFDFNTLKGSIVSAIDVCSGDISKTAGSIQSVVDEHTRLQEQLSFDPTEEIPGEKEETPKSGNSKKRNNFKSSYYGGPGVGTKNYNDKNNKNGETPSKYAMKSISEAFVALGFVNINRDLLRGESPINSGDMKYDQDGFARIGDKYVVSCSSNQYKVGDEFTLEQSNGDKIICVVGVVSNDSNNQSVLNFVVSEDAVAEVVETKGLAIINSCVGVIKTKEGD